MTTVSVYWTREAAEASGFSPEDKIIKVQDIEVTIVEMTDAQDAALIRIHTDYQMHYDPTEWTHPFDLPSGWVAGWVGKTYVGVSPEGSIHS